jgi:hypothetical protein
LSVDAERNYIVTFRHGVWKVAQRRPTARRRLSGSGAVWPLRGVPPITATLGTYVDLTEATGHREGPLCGDFRDGPAEGYEKIFTFIRADNPAALATYRTQGFEVVGTARGHAKIDGRYIDEILIEKMFDRD